MFSLKSTCASVLGLSEKACHLFVNGLLGAFSEGALLAELRTAQVSRIVGSVSDRSKTRGKAPLLDHPHASWVAPERSLAAPVEASPSIRISDARPPRRTAKESRR